MARKKVEICGVNTSSLPLLSEEEKEDLFDSNTTNYGIVCICGIIPASALRGQNTKDIVNSLFKYMPYGPMFYDEDTVTDQPERQIVAELIREKALRLLDDEIPHGIAVVIEQMKERPNGNY